MFLYGIGLMLLFISCKDSGPESPSFTPGKRDYVWSIDSVDYGSLPGTIQLKSIWGNSARDIWGVNGDAPDVRDCLWHYDGTRWSRATAGTPITEFTGNKAVYAVWGSARNNLWTVGRKINQGVLSAFIMHYDGTRWTDATPTNVSTIQGHLYGILGISQSNIWAYGYEHAIHWNGSQWTDYPIVDSMIVGSMASNQIGTYLQLYSPWGGSTIYIYRLIGNNFSRIDSTIVPQNKFGGEIWIVNSEFCSIENGLLSTNVLANGDINTTGWTRRFTTPSFFSERFVQRPENILLVGQFNLIYHFNGSDWRRIYLNIPNHTVSPQSLFRGVWTDGNEAFICDTYEGIVYHGR